MIYHYYCTNCGNELQGEEIVFDLAQILDLRSEKGNLFIKFTPQDLMELAERNGKTLEHGVRISLQIRLFDLLGFMAQDMEEARDREAMQRLTYEQFVDADAVKRLMGDCGLQNADVQEENVRALVDLIAAKLRLEQKTEEEVSEEDWGNDTHNYVMDFWIEPVFFEGTQTLDTIRYTCGEGQANLLPLSFAKAEIRGYCPKCCRPVLKGSGKYEHILVGFLGAQSAGKTTLFVSMINDVKNYFVQLGIALPEVLCDGKFEKIKEAMRFNSNGWAVGKTDAEAKNQSYNASLLIKGREKTVILSFIDIAGELCYDEKQGIVQVEQALNNFPLIASCHLYMLCTCVSQTGYGEEDENTAAIPNTALIQIAQDIYNNRKYQCKTPPMCLVVTKVDKALEQKAQARNAFQPPQQNPFEELAEMQRRKRIRPNDGAAFDLLGQMEYLKNLYQSTADEDILDSLTWCRRTYDNNQDMTYMSMISCSALGMRGRKFEPEKHNFDKDGDKFRPNQLDAVWTWILCNVGMTPAVQDYRLTEIPSYGKSIMEPRMGKEPVERLQKEVCEKVKAIQALYLNLSEVDSDWRLWGMEEWTFADKVRHIAERKFDEIINKYAERNPQ